MVRQRIDRCRAWREVFSQMVPDHIDRGNKAIGGTALALGQTTKSASMPVVAASDTDARASGTINSATPNATYALALNGQGTVGLLIAGLTASGATLRETLYSVWR